MQPSLVDKLHSATKSVLKSQANVLISTDLRLAPSPIDSPVSTPLIRHHVLVCVPLPHPTLTTLVLVTNASPRLDPSTSSDMTLLLTTQHYQDRRFFIAWSSAVNYDFVAATVFTGKYTNIPPDILISLIFTKILGHLTL